MDAQEKKSTPHKVLGRKGMGGRVMGEGTLTMAGVSKEMREGAEERARGTISVTASQEDPIITQVETGKGKGTEGSTEIDIKTEKVKKTEDTMDRGALADA